MSKVVDGGRPREVNKTGAEREASSGQGRFDLIPPYPQLRLAQHYEAGARKYADRNWEKGLPLPRFIESLERHVNKFKQNRRDEDHLAAVLWNAFGYIHTEREIALGNLPASLAKGCIWLPSLSIEELTK